MAAQTLVLCKVANLLLHNTKNMVAIPDRMYDLRNPGWLD